jgi:maltooligosyltrehalose trehalohydrolase
MLFQGQEFASTNPFLYFADHHPDLARQVRQGRGEFLKQFPALALPEAQASLTDPGDPQTFAACKLDLAQRESNQAMYDLHKDLLRLRREDPAFRAQQRRGVDGAVLGAQSLVLRFLENGPQDRLLIVNLGRDLHLDPAPEPLLAPPEGMRWETLWSSEELRYGGCGTSAVEGDEGWRIPGEAAVVLKPVISHEDLP